MNGSALTAIAVALALAGCSPKIDGSSDEALTTSVEKISKSLPEEKRKEFTDALTIIGVSQINMEDIFSGRDTADTFGAKMRQAVDGLTAEKVIQKAAGIRNERETKEREQALSEIKELIAKRDAAAKAAESLKDFRVIRARYLSGRGYFGTDTGIDLTVKNETGKAISKAYFKAVLASPGRAVPWLSEDFNYEIPGGIEPGEEKSWSLSAPFSWRDPDAPKDAILTVTPVRMDGPDGVALFDTEQFGDSDVERLAALQKRFG